MDKINLTYGDRTIEVTPNALEEFVSVIDNGGCGSKLESGTQEVSQFWHELRTLTPAYAGGDSN